MLNFADEEAYVNAFAKNPALAIMGVGMVAKMIGIQRPAVEKRIEKGTLKGIKVGNSMHVLTHSILDNLQKEHKMRAQVFDTLVNIARGHTTIPYSALMAQIGLDYRLSPHRKKIGEILGSISEETFAAKGVLLSVLVVDKTTGMPSDSFWWLFERLTGKGFKNHDAVMASHKQKVYKLYG